MGAFSVRLGNFLFSVFFVAAGAHALGVVQIWGVETLCGKPMVLCDSIEKSSQVILVTNSLDFMTYFVLWFIRLNVCRENIFRNLLTVKLERKRCLWKVFVVGAGADGNLRIFLTFQSDFFSKVFRIFSSWTISYYLTEFGGLLHSLFTILSRFIFFVFSKFSKWLLTTVFVL